MVPSSLWRMPTAGAVIAAVSEERVKSLVYVAALAPDEGETVAQVFYRDEAIRKHPSWLRTRMALSGCPTMDLPGSRSQGFRQTKQANPDCRAAADLGSVHSRKGAGAGMENKAVLVPACRRGPHDQSEDPADSWPIGWAQKSGPSQVDHSPMYSTDLVVDVILEAARESTCRMTCEYKDHHAREIP